MFRRRHSSSDSDLENENPNRQRGRKRRFRARTFFDDQDLTAQEYKEKFRVPKEVVNKLRHFRPKI